MNKTEELAQTRQRCEDLLSGLRGLETDVDRMRLMAADIESMISQAITCLNVLVLAEVGATEVVL